MMRQDMEEAMEQKNRIAAVVVTYNRKELLRECITALLAQSMNQLDICLFAGIIHCQITNIIIICREKSDTCMSFRYIIYSCKLSRHICNHFLAEHMCLHLYNLHKLNPFITIQVGPSLTT